MYLRPIPPGALVVLIVWAFMLVLGHHLFGTLGVLFAIVAPPTLAFVMRVRAAYKGDPK